LSAIAVLVSSIVYAFTRDTNAYALLGVAFVCACLVLGRALLASVRRYLGVCAATLLVFLAGYATAQLGDRWVHALYHNVSKRVLPVPEVCASSSRAGCRSATRCWNAGSWALMK
jgi:hypothetical protein